jgi:general secretion pathway protein G
MKKRNGFTLVEILIVVVILGILAAIVIPQFSDASTEAKLSSLVSDLQTVRSQIELYKIQHNGALPGATSAAFVTQMTTYTMVDGTAAATQAPGVGVYGPYLQAVPKNPFNNCNVVTVNGTLGDGALASGWEFNTTTGAFYADDSVTATPAHTTY